jgi:hypothetical protein
MVITGMAHPQGGRPAAIFDPLRHPMPYTYGEGTGSPLQKNSQTEVLEDPNLLISSEISN